MMPVSRLARTGLTKRLSGGKSHSLRLVYPISFRIVLCVGSLTLSFGGLYGVLSRIGPAGAVDFVAADIAAVDADFADRYLAPSKPQLGQSL